MGDLLGILDLNNLLLKYVNPILNGIENIGQDLIIAATLIAAIEIVILAIRSRENAINFMGVFFERLLKFYNSAYEQTKDIERFSSVLDFGSEVLGKEKYESLEKFSIDNNSLYAINIKKTRENMIEEEYENPKIRIKNKQYIILQ